MRQTLRWSLSAVILWQAVPLVAVLFGVPLHKEQTAPLHAPGPAQFASTLFEPSEDDLRRAILDVEAVRPNPAEGRALAWQTGLVSSLRSSDLALARRICNGEDASFSKDQKDEANTLLDKLAAVPEDVEAQSKLAALLATVSYRLAGLEEWAREIWQSAQTSAQRSRLAEVLAGFHSDADQSTLLGAALLFAAASPDTIKVDAPGLALAFAYTLSGKDQRLSALAIYREVEKRTSLGPNWGAAVFNQGVLLNELGSPLEARQVLRRLIASSVNDRDPGATLMETSRNYRHRAANLLADSYLMDWDAFSAYRWRFQAAERYPFRSWCGTCAGAAQFQVSVHLLRDAAHLVRNPGRTWLVWLGIILVALPVAVWLRRRARPWPALPGPAVGPYE